MMQDANTISTARLKLRPFATSDTDAFAELNSDPQVMADLGGPLTRQQSDTKLSGYIATAAQNGFGRFVVEDKCGKFLGYCGIMERNIDALGVHYDLGWRLARSAWGNGFASEAAVAILADAFSRLNFPEVLAYTGPDNLRSQEVMERLKLRRRKDLDFSMKLDSMKGLWHGLVWSAQPSAYKNKSQTWFQSV
ncbi:MAG: GNAT family N-acetyltransferase [Roseibium sp.]